MSGSVQALFEAVRAECSAATWSRGVELSRADAVSGEEDAGDEVVLRVATRGGLVSPAVTLHPDEPDWDCDCAAPESPCEHVAAAVIALRRARQAGQALPGSERASGRVGYRLSRTGSGLALERVIVRGDHSEPLKSTLAAIASGRVDGPAFVATPADVEVERALGTRLRGPLPRGVLPALLARLATCPDVQLDGLPVRTSADAVGRRVRVHDDGDDFRLVVERDPRITELIGDGVALCGDTLQPLSEAGLTGRELESYARGGRRFAAGEAAVLVAEVLPSLRGRVPVEVETQRLPRAVAEPPRLRLEVRREGDALAVLPTLVYGDPPLARIDAGRLVSLGAGPVPLRDADAEDRLVGRLQRELALLPGHKVALEGDAAVAFAERLRHWHGEIRGDAHEQFFRAAPLVARFRPLEADFEVRFASGEREVRPAQVLRAWRDGASLVPLPGGGFAPLPSDWLERYGARLADLLAAREATGALPRCALPELARLCEELDLPPPPACEELRALLGGAGTGSALPHAALPADLRAELRRYQREGVDWLCLLRDAGLGALLADDMGLGKTLQALCALRGRTLVVAPTSVVHNWAEEIARFRPGLRASVYQGTRRALDPGADVTLTSYAILRLDADKLAAQAWDSVVLDEAQAIKNPDSQVARAAYRLGAGFRLTLTGTPVENRLDELWSQLHFTNPGLLGSRRDFEEHSARAVARGDPGAALRLRERVRPFVLRRLKREVAPELPPRTEVTLRAELDAEERAVYEAIRAATRADVIERLAAGGNVLQALEALLRLRQAACHRALVPGQTAPGSSKLELLLEVAGEALAEGHKALVFSQWTSLLDLVEPHLRAAAIEFARLDGSTRDRAGVVRRFQDEAGPPLLLASLKAGGTGLNLTAADCVFLLDPWWNPAAEDQAADRAHRIGQDRPVLVYRLVASDTVEERILELQQRKRGLAQAALGGAEAAGAITRSDLLALLR